MPGGLLPSEPGSGRGRRHGTSSSEPFDRWFRYPAGFASDYVTQLLQGLDLERGSLVLDPFAGSAVTGTSARSMGFDFFGIEAHPAIAELGGLKLRRPPRSVWSLDETADRLAEAAAKQARRGTQDLSAEADLTRRCFTPSVLTELVALRNMIRAGEARSWALHTKWALLGTLRDVACVRVGWPYQSPSKQRQPRFLDPLARFRQRVAWMSEDIRNLGKTANTNASARVAKGDARDPAAWGPIEPESGRGCVSSPPYLNNFDYADATRIELYFWGDISTWSQMCSTVRSGMLTATTQQSSVGAARTAEQNLQRYGEVAATVNRLVDELRDQRESRRRGKEYDRVVPDYFAAIARVLANLARAMAPGAPVVWLVGDSAPYGIYIDTPALISKLAEQVGFVAEKDVILRHRGKRWAGNTTRHGVELSERLILLRRTD
jgi:hypothetical protein